MNRMGRYLERAEVCVRGLENLGLNEDKRVMNNYQPCLSHRGKIKTNKTGCSRYQVPRGPNCNWLKVIGLCGISASRELDARDCKKGRKG